MQEARSEFAGNVRNKKDAVEIAELASQVDFKTIYVTHVGHGFVEDDGDIIDIEADWNVLGIASLMGRYKYSDFRRSSLFQYFWMGWMKTCGSTRKPRPCFNDKSQPPIFENSLSGSGT